MNRRELLTSTAMLIPGSATLTRLLAPVKALAAAVQPIRIKDVEAFNIEIPATATEVEAGVTNRMAVTRVATESGVRGYSFGGAGGLGGHPGGAAARPRCRCRAAGARRARLGVNAEAFQQIRKTLVGSDLFAMEQHLKRGLLNWGGIEEAMWDAIGKIAGQPVYRMLGGSKTSVPVYITAVWRGNADQSQVPIKDQAVYARRLKDAGFNAFKMRIFRPDFMDDVESCAGIIAACGSGFQSDGRPDGASVRHRVGLSHRIGRRQSASRGRCLLAGRAVFT